MRFGSLIWRSCLAVLLGSAVQWSQATVLQQGQQGSGAEGDRGAAPALQSVSVATSAAISAATPVQAGSTRALDLEAAARLWSDHVQRLARVGSQTDHAGGDQAGPMVEQDLELAKVVLANELINAVAYQPDIQTWGRDDFWATPLEMLAAGAGDCEDFAVAKMMLLMEAGVDPARLRLLYANALGVEGGRSKHLTLLYLPAGQAWTNADPWVVDQLSPQMLRLSVRTDLNPVFSFDTRAIYEAAGGPELSSVSRLAPFVRVLEARATQLAGLTGYAARPAAQRPDARTSKVALLSLIGTAR